MKRFGVWFSILFPLLVLALVLTSKLPVTACLALTLVQGIPSPILSAPQNRRLFTSNFTQNNTDRIYSPDFPRSTYSKLMCQLSGNLTKTESGAGTLSDNCLSLIRSIRIKLDGDPVKEFEPAMIRPLSHHVFRQIDTDITNITLGSDTAEAFSARFAIDFQSGRSRLPEASYLPGDRYGELAFEVDWGAYTDLVGGGTYTGVSFSTNPTLAVYGEEILNPVDKARPFLIHKYFTKTFTRNATAETASVFQLPVGETYRGIMIRQLTRTPDLGISTIFTSTANIVVRVNGSYRKLETTWDELTKRNKSQYGIALPTGFAFIDFCEDGDFSKALRTGDNVGVSQLEILGDVASVSNGVVQMMGVTYKAARAA